MPVALADLAQCWQRAGPADGHDVGGIPAPPARSHAALRRRYRQRAVVAKPEITGARPAQAALPPAAAAPNEPAPARRRPRPGACFTSRVTSREMAFLVLSSGKAANPESIHGAHRILCRKRGSGASPLIYCRSRLLRSRIDARHAACHLVARGLRCEGRLMRGT